MKILLSIKPEFANKIFAGSKKFEFRKTLFKRQDIKKVVVYASSPVQRVIGEFEIQDLLTLDKEILWEETKKFAGINKDFYDEYFKNKDEASAIKIGKVKKYSTPKRLIDFDIFFAPQSFIYL